MKRLKVFLLVLVMSIFSISLVYAVDMGEILSAETRSGSIASPSQTDLFTFNGNVGQTVIIGMSRQSGVVDPQIDLYDPDGFLETQVFCGNCDFRSIENYQLLKSGLYTIVVRDTGGNDTGNYSLSLLLIPGPTVSPQDPDGGDILSNETKLGAISQNADTDTYTFNGNVGQTVIIGMSRQSGVVDPQIDLYDPDGFLETQVFCGNCDFRSIENYQLLKSGLYIIVARDTGGNDTGNYSLSYTKTPGTQYTPSVRINLNQDTFNTDGELIVSAHVTNGPDPVDAEVKLWITLPDGSNMSIFDSHFTFTIGANADFTAEIFRYTFVGSEPSGDYDAAGRLTDPVTGREQSVNVETFSFSP